MMPVGLTEFDDGITAIDTGYVQPGLAASHLIVRCGRAAFVDTGTTPSLPRLMNALVDCGVSAEDVDYIFLTHIHLDHAGGAGALLQELPNATVVVHPSGASHLAEPARLEAGTRAVYGDAKFRRLYQEIVPIDPDRIRTVAEGDQIELGGARFDFLHTPGHALHHVSIVDHQANAVFAGDTFGISYRALDTRRGAFIFPATTPVHFDPDAAHASIERLISLRPDAIYLTHYSQVTELERLAENLHSDLVAFVEIAHRCANNPDRSREIANLMRAYLGARLDEHGFPDDENRRSEWLEMDIALNTQGLEDWLDRQQREKG